MINLRGRPLANDHPEGPASFKWSSGGAGLLQMMIRRDQPLANDHPEGPASCKWSSEGGGLLQTCKWSSGGASLLQTIIRRDRPLANDHPEGLTICKWSSGCAGLLHKRFALFNWSSFNCNWAQNAIPIPTKINFTQNLIPWPAIEWLLHLRCCNHVSNNGTVTSGSRVWNTHLWWKFSGTTYTWYLI